MIVLNLELNHIYGFENFHINFTYPKKVVNSIIEDEFLNGRERFRYNRAVILMGANATGKTSLGRALLKIFTYLNTGNSAVLFDTVQNGERGQFCIDFVNKGYTMHRVSAQIDSVTGDVEIQYYSCEIAKMDSYEKAVGKLENHTSEATKSVSALRKLVGELHYRFAYPEIESTLKVAGTNQKTLLKTLRAVIGTLDPTLTDISVSRDLKDSFIIRRKSDEIIIQDGKLLNKEVLSSGTAEGVDVAVFLASMMVRNDTFYYCDEHFSYIQSDIEKRIFGIMLGCLGRDEQLIFTTHNTDMLDLNLPKHSYVFLRKEIDGGECRISAVRASDMLKRNTDSVRNAVENDVFSSLPDDSLLDELEMGWNDGQC